MLHLVGRPLRVRRDGKLDCRGRQQFLARQFVAFAPVHVMLDRQAQQMQTLGEMDQRTYLHMRVLLMCTEYSSDRIALHILYLATGGYFREVQ